MGGWAGFSAGLRTLPSELLEAPGVLKVTWQGGPWTAMMILTYMFALMGIQASPAFTMWAFANRDTRPFAIQQVWASALLIGGLLFVFSTIQGLGGRLLGYENLFPLGEVGVEHIPGSRWSPMARSGSVANSDMLVPTLMTHLMGTPLMVFTAIAALAATQSTGAAYMATFSGMFTRDLYVRYVNPRASEPQQAWFGRILVVAVTAAALLVAAFASSAMVAAGWTGRGLWLPDVPGLAARAGGP